MNIKFTLTIVFFLNLSLIKAQEITEEKRAFYSKMLYGTNKPILEKDNFVYKKEDYIESDFFSEINSPAEINNCVDVITKTGKLEIKEWMGDKNLFFTSELSEKHKEQITDQLSVDLIKNNLINAKGDTIKLRNIHNSSTGYKKIKLKTEVSKDIIDFKNISGDVIYNVSFLTDYDKVELSNKKVGNEFKLNNCEFKLIKIIHNKLIIEKLCDSDVDINVVNFSKNNKVIKPYSMFKLAEMKEKDESIDTGGSFSKSNTTVNKSIYDIFDANPEISLEEFDKKMTVEFLKKVKSSGKYIIVKNIAPFENKFILYAPKYDIKEVKIRF